MLIHKYRNLNSAEQERLLMKLIKTPLREENSSTIDFKRDASLGKQEQLISLLPFKNNISLAKLLKSICFGNQDSQEVKLAPSIILDQF